MKTNSVYKKVEERKVGKYRKVRDDCVGCYFFFFKQKTAYEIGTGDWSSDVCSSDLALMKCFVSTHQLALINSQSEFDALINSQSDFDRVMNNQSELDQFRYKSYEYSEFPVR